MKRPIVPIKHAKPAVLPGAALATVRGGSGKPIIRNGADDDPGTDGGGTIRNKGTT